MPGIFVALAGLLAFAMMFEFGLPGIAAALLLGMITVVTLSRPEMATIVVLFVMYSNAAAVAVRSHGVPSIAATGFFLLLLVPIISYVIFAREPLRGDTVLALMAAYLVPLMASALLSDYTSDTFETISRFVFEGLVIYLLIINAVRSPKVLRQAIWAVLLGGGMLAGITVCQELTKTYDNEYGGFALTKIVNARGYLDEANTETGEKDAKGQSISRPRASGPIGDPNFYGQVLCAVLPFGLVLLFSHPRRSLRLAAGAISLLLIGAILLTFSRGAMLAVAGLTLLLLLLRYLKIRHLVVVSALIAIAIVFNPAYRERLSTFSFLQQSQGMRDADYSVRERATILLAGARVFLDHPVFGVGPGQSSKYIAGYGNAHGFAKIRANMEAHNTYLQQLDETGVFGFLFLASIVALTLRNLFQIRKRWRTERPEYAHIATALFLSVLMFLITSLFLHLAFPRYLFLLLGLGGAAVLIYRAEELEAGSKPERKALAGKGPLW